MPDDLYARALGKLDGVYKSPSSDEWPMVQLLRALLVERQQTSSKPPECGIREHRPLRFPLCSVCQRIARWEKSESTLRAFVEGGSDAR